MVLKTWSLSHIFEVMPLDRFSRPSHRKWARAKPPLWATLVPHSQSNTEVRLVPFPRPNVWTEFFSLSNDSFLGYS